MDAEHRSERGTTFVIRAPQDLVAGLVLLAFSAAVLVLLARIHTVSFASISPTLFPRLCAYSIAIGGIVLVIRGFAINGPRIEPIPARGPLLVTIAVVLFGLLTPVVGYVIAGFLTVVIGGLGTREARLRDLVFLAAGLVFFCLLLFTVGLKLTIPVLQWPSF
jgi:hypothetical protein